MGDEFFPLIDPETGEYLAGDDEERWALVRELAELLVFAAKASQRVSDLKRMLGILMCEAEAVAVDGWAVRVQPGAPARRAVNTQAVLAHAEALRPLGLAAEPGPAPLIFPSVSALTATGARKSLGRLGLTPETFLLMGDPGPPRVVVDAPDD